MKTHPYYSWPTSLWLVAFFCLVAFGKALAVQNSLVAWGGGIFVNPPSGVTNVASTSVGITLLRDGRLSTWASPPFTNVPAAATDLTALAGNFDKWVGLRRDGSVINQQGTVLPPADAVAIAAALSSSYGFGALSRKGVLQTWDGINWPDTPNGVAISGGGYATVHMLLTDGTVFPQPFGASAALTNLVAVADGQAFVGLRSDGTVVSVLGGGTYIPAVTNAIAVAAGGFHGLALKADRKVIAWGNNSYGQTNVPSGLSNVVAIAAGGTHNLALKADGTVVAWGSSTGTNVPPGLSNVAAIFADWNFSAAIVGASPPTLLSQPPDETVWNGRPATFTMKAIGSAPLKFQWQFNGETISGATNSFYRIAATGPANAGVYTLVVSNDRGTAISREATLTVMADPHLVTQPTNQTVMLGANTTFAALADGSQSVSYQWYFGTNLISGATNSSLELTNISLGHAGNYWATASNVFGVRTSSIAALAPLALYGADNETPPNLLAISAIAAGGGNSFVLKPDGTAAFWGADDYVWPGMQLTGLSNIVAMAAGHQFVLLLHSNGTVLGRGLNNDYGQFTIPPGLSDVVAISAGSLHSLALRANGTVWAWGANFYNQANVPGGLTQVVSLSGGGYHSLALRSNGTVVAWGYHEFGQTNVPPGLSNVVAVAAGGHHSMALRGNGTVVAWGYNGFGQTNVPAGLSNVVAIAAGFYYSLALRSDGTVVGWGDVPSFDPSTLRNVVAIAAGHSHALALRGEALVAPPVQTAAGVRTANSFHLPTSTLRGRNYYLQHRDSINSGPWILHPPVPGNGTVRTLTDSSASVPQRYYRVWQKP